MRILMQPIEMIAWFTLEGTPNPIRYKMTSADASNLVIKVDRIVARSEEKLAGNRMIIFRCQGEVNERLKLYEPKYELNTCKWYLYKAVLSHFFKKWNGLRPPKKTKANPTLLLT